MPPVAEPIAETMIGVYCSLETTVALKAKSDTIRINCNNKDLGMNELFWLLPAVVLTIGLVILVRRYQK